MKRPPKSPSDAASGDVDGPTKARRSPVPEGTGKVGAALVIAGMATYGFLVIGSKAVGGDTEFEPITSLWFAIFALAPGFFLPLEQELGRALSARRARGEGARPVVRKVGVVCVGVVVAVLAVLAIGSGPITDEYFNGNLVLLLALAIAFTTYAPAHIARGISAGQGRFGSYALVISSDGVIRVLGALTFWIFGVTSIAAFALLVAISPIFAVVFVWSRGWLETEDGPEAPWAEVNQNLGWLMLGTVAAAALLNAGPIAAKLLAGPNETALVTRFGYGVFLSRVPLFMYQAVQAALLPRLSRLATQGKYDEFKSGFRSLLLLVTVVGVVGVAGAYLLGPWVIEIVFSSTLGGRTLAMLALSSALYMAALACAQAVIAVNGHREVAMGWVLAFAGFFATSMWGGWQAFRRIEIALVLASAIALVTFAVALQRRLAAGERATPDNLWFAVTDNPLEG